MTNTRFGRVGFGVGRVIGGMDDFGSWGGGGGGRASIEQDT